MAPICTDVRRKFAKTIELQALNLTLVSCPKGAFPLPNTVHGRNPLRDERPVPVPPELWRQPPIWPWALSLLRSSPFSSPFSPHSSTSPSSPQSERGVNKPHVSGKNLERAASQTKVPRALLPLPPPSLSSTLSLGTGLDGFRWMAAVCWGRMAAGAGRGWSDVIVCRHAGRGNECPALAWKVSPLELMNGRVELSVHRMWSGSVLDFNLDELVYKVLLREGKWGCIEDLHKFAWRACTVQQGVRLEKQRVFHVAFALCLSVSLVGGWLNESCGQRLRYKKLWFGFQGSFGGCYRKGKPTLYLWLLDSLCTLLLPRCPATYRMKRGTYQIHHRWQGTESNYPKHFCRGAELRVFSFWLISQDGWGYKNLGLIVIVWTPRRRRAWKMTTNICECKRSIVMKKQQGSKR